MDKNDYPERICVNKSKLHDQRFVAYPFDGRATGENEVYVRADLASSYGQGFADGERFGRSQQEEE